MAWKWLRSVLVLLAFQVCGFHSAAAQDLRAQLLKLTRRSDSLSIARPAEKLYLQFDKPYYTLGDTIWFKAYLLNSTSLSATDKSGMLYIDMVTDSGKTVGRYRFPAGSGLSWGNIVIDGKQFPPGNYTLYAYTTWLRNFGSDYYFSKRLEISASAENTVLAKTAFETTVVNGVAMVNAKLEFSRLDKTPFAAEPLQVRVLSGTHSIYREKMLTGVDGIVNLNFELPKKSSELTLVAGTNKIGRLAVIPLPMNRPENADVQFMPEGGTLIAGFPAHIGFKAIGEDGRGLSISGTVVDQNQRPVTAFTTTHAGMGSFNMDANAGEIYHANVTLPGGLIKQYPLPPVKSSGTLMRIRNTPDADSLQVTLAASDDVVQARESYYLIAKARDIVCYAAIIKIPKEGVTTEHIPKSLFPTGIVRLTLMGTQYRPLNERQVFIDHHDQLQVAVTTDKATYKFADSVVVKIKVTDRSGRPVKADLSATVTDNAQVKWNSLNDEHILTQVLLTEGLKGYVEEPGYYFSKKADAWQALDNLLLTQGWVGYDWSAVATPPVIDYPAEAGLQVRGKVSTGGNNAVKATHISLFSKSPLVLMDTVTDDKGRFVFEGFPRVDTPIFVLKAVNKRGKSTNVIVNVDDSPQPDLPAINIPAINPWYVNADSTLLNYTKTSAKQQETEIYKGSEHMLKAVNITAAKIIKDSRNLNGPGEADVIIDEKELEAAGHKNLRQLLEEKVRGFHDGFIPMTSIEWYMIDDLPVIMLVDGVRLTDVFPYFRFPDFRNYLESLDAGDIKGIEVIHAGRYSGSYDVRYRLTPNKHCFIELTSRAGHGPGINDVQGMYLYRPLPVSWPKQFYKPKYGVKDPVASGKDLRSTIDWEPNLVTNDEGEATFWFYTKRKDAYSIVVEGADLKGGLGFGEEPPAP